MKFEDVKPQARRAKVLLIGEAGTGKSHAALTFPKPVVIDAEGSIDWFADRFTFKAVATKSYSDVRDLVRQVREGRVDCETLVIDGWTTIYNGLINVASGSGENDLSPRDWGRIKRKNSSVLDELYHKLPVHVVCIGWLGAEYAKAGTVVRGQVVKPNDMVQIGEKLDGDKKTAHAFDFIFKLLGNDGQRARALVMKSRSGGLKNGQIIEDFSWKTIEPLLGHGDRTYVGMTDEEAAERDAKGDSQEPERTPKGKNGMTRAEAQARKNTGDAPCPDCHAPAGKVHATSCQRPQDVAPAAVPAVDSTSGANAPAATADAGAGDERPPASASDSKTEKPQEQRRRERVHALHHDLGHDDATRRMMYERLFKKTSSRQLRYPDEVEHVIHELEFLQKHPDLEAAAS
jgi:hypothetical protein